MVGRDTYSARVPKPVQERSDPLRNIVHQKERVGKKRRVRVKGKGWRRPHRRKERRKRGVQLRSLKKKEGKDSGEQE